MRVGLIFVVLLVSTLSVFSQHIKVPAVDTVPGKSAIVPFKIKLPPLPLPHLMLSKAEKLNLRVDYGIAKHSNAFTVQLREAF